MANQFGEQLPDVPPAELARVVVLGGTILQCVYLGLENDASIANDINDTYENIVKPLGNDKLPEEAGISERDRLNVEAGAIIIRLTRELVMADDSPNDWTKEEPVNPWTALTTTVMKDVGFINAAGRPSTALKLAAPALKKIYSGVPDPTAISNLLPQNQDFSEALVQYSHIATRYIQQIPTIHREHLDIDDLIQAIHDFDPTKLPQAEMPDGNWNLDDITRDVPVQQESVIRYAELRLDNAAEYLTNLLTDIETLNNRLRN